MKKLRIKDIIPLFGQSGSEGLEESDASQYMYELKNVSHLLDKDGVLSFSIQSQSNNPVRYYKGTVVDNDWKLNFYPGEICHVMPSPRNVVAFVNMGESTDASIIIYEPAKDSDGIIEVAK